jgi:hypothetical protein
MTTAGWARGRVPFWARSPRKEPGAKWVWVRVGSWRGPFGSTRGGPGGAGVPEGGRREGKKPPQKLCTAYPGGVCRRLTCGHGIGASPARGVERRVRRSAIPKDLMLSSAWRPLPCPCVAIAYCGALANHRAQVECVTGRTAPPRSLRRCRVGGFGPSAI